MIKMDTIPIFSTPILIADFEKHNEYKDKFVDVPKFERKPKTWIAPVNTSFPQVRPGDDVMPDGLKEDILENIKSIMSFNGLPQEIDYNNFWYNIYYDKQGQERHDHLSPKNNNPFWSGIYFAKNCFTGSFFIHKTDISLRAQSWCDWTKSKLKDYYSDSIQFPIEDGKIILFPPSVIHSVQTDKRNKDAMRLTFSFNIVLNSSVK